VPYLNIPVFERPNPIENFERTSGQFSERRISWTSLTFRMRIFPEFHSYEILQRNIETRLLLFLKLLPDIRDILEGGGFDPDRENHRCHSLNGTPTP
jgi:hypothetical protein